MTQRKEDIMSLTRKMLKGMSLTDEQIDTIIENHTETVNGLKEDIESLKESNETLSKDNKKLERVSKDYEELKKTISESDNPYLTQYEDEKKKHAETKAEYEKYKAGVEAKETESKKSNAYRKLLLDAGISDKLVDQVLNLAKANKKLDNIEFDEKGEVKENTKIVENIKTDYASFIPTKQEQGAETATPPQNIGGNGGNSRVAEMVRARRANMFGEIKND